MAPNDKTELGLLARGGLLVPDVAALFTEAEQGLEDAQARGDGRTPDTVKPVSERTVVSFVDFSQPRGRSLQGSDQRLANPDVRNRYEDNPMPLPIRLRNQIMVWVPDRDNPDETLGDVRDALKTWYVERLIRR